MKTDDQIQIWSLLYDADNYRAYLQSYVDWKKLKRRDFGYASFARDAGFTARSYPRDVINGNRQLTAASIPRFAKAMKLTGAVARYFHLLVCKDRPDLFPDTSPEEFADLLMKAREKLGRQIVNRSQPVGKVYSQNSWPLVYAGLGAELVGASLREVALRCHLPEATCLQILGSMVKAEVVKHDLLSDRYFPMNAHLIYQDLGENSGFQDFFLSSLRRSEQTAKKDFHRTDRLFFSSAISIRRSDLKEYRDKLRDLLNNFAETAENPTGDEVVTIVSGFFPNHAGESGD